MRKIQSAERVSQNDASDNYVYQRSILAYRKAAEAVSGDVLEVGTGAGYGIGVIAPRAERFLTIDKTVPAPELLAGRGNVEFRRMNVPPLEGIPSDSFDYVISFQVIEHIGRDARAIEEMHRVLRPGGKLIISTPNKPMSLTRNPWHVREYTAGEFMRLLGNVFGEAGVEPLGVFGNEKVAAYYEKNRESVRAIMKYDILRLQKILPRWMLKIPYDIMNRRNRRKLLKGNTALTSSITMDDYRLAPADDSCYDLYYVATK
jgi:SAM-dependent methyltransferase